MPHVFSFKISSIVDFIIEQKEDKIESLYDVGRVVHWTSLENVVESVLVYRSTGLQT